MKLYPGSHGLGVRFGLSSAQKWIQGSSYVFTFVNVWTGCGPMDGRRCWCWGPPTCRTLSTRRCAAASTSGSTSRCQRKTLARTCSRLGLHTDIEPLLSHSTTGGFGSPPNFSHLHPAAGGERPPAPQGVLRVCGVMIVSRLQGPRSVECDDSITPAGPSGR
eukprot:1181820-Prorocentrum_minimum.AAC.2